MKIIVPSTESNNEEISYDLARKDVLETAFPTSGTECATMTLLWTIINEYVVKFEQKEFNDLILMHTKHHIICKIVRLCFWPHQSGPEDDR